MASSIIRRNNIHQFGSGRQPMLFAHGFGCDQRMWRLITPAFADAYRITLFDYVGSGSSDLDAYQAERYNSIDGYVQDILEICTELDLREIVFVGHSVSSIIGLLAAIQAPERFQRLIMVSPSPRYINTGDYQGGFERSDVLELLDMMDHNYLGWASFLAPVIMQAPDRPELAAELQDSFCSTDPNIARRFAEVTFFADNRADLGRVPVPALILQCSNDAIAPVEVGHYMHRQMPGSTLALMDAVGHCPHMSAPEETIRLMQAYLSAPLHQ